MRTFPHGTIIWFIIVSAAHAGSANIGQTATGEIANSIRDVYDGRRALETVAFLDQYIRWPGNRGFDPSIDHIVAVLAASGYLKEDKSAADARLTYRVEEYAMQHPAWQPLDASLSIAGSDVPVLEFADNRNMLARGSFSTPDGGVTAELVLVDSVAELAETDIQGKIVMADGELSSWFEEAVVKHGAAGILAYSMPAYLKPEVNRHSIQFRSIPDDIGMHRSWAISLSTDARDVLRSALTHGPVRLRVTADVLWSDNAVERTVVADIRGREYPDERFVISAHVQEPGANDNASGVAAQLEMARVAAQLLSAGTFDPGRSITFLWGQEILSTDRYIKQDASRSKGILWGLSLDMVGEDTDKTGGTFRIEKMPDPSAIWTRGADHHTEWGADPLKKGDMTPHYFNDLVYGRAMEQAATNGWIVDTNPFEGGSDHVPFLKSGIPGLLLWHFTDQFYHTDRDRLDMVSPEEVTNVGVTALTTAVALTTANGVTAREFVEEVRTAAIDRLTAETALSAAELVAGGSVAEQRDIIATWGDWYDKALESTHDIEVGGSSVSTKAAIESARRSVLQALTENLAKIDDHRQRRADE